MVNKMAEKKKENSVEEHEKSKKEKMYSERKVKLPPEILKILPTAYSIVGDNKKKSQ